MLQVLCEQVMVLPVLSNLQSSRWGSNKEIGASAMASRSRQGCDREAWALRFV